MSKFPNKDRETYQNASNKARQPLCAVESCVNDEGMALRRRLAGAGAKPLQAAWS